MFKRILIAGGVALLGVFLLPQLKALAVELAGYVSDEIPSQVPYAPFMYLVNDHIYLAIFVLWTIAVLAILFWPTGERSDIASK